MTIIPPTPTAEHVRREHPAISVIAHDRNLGFSRACNHGSRLAQGKNLLFLNSDTEARAGGFDELLAWLQNHPQSGIVGPELLRTKSQLLQMSWGWDPLLFKELIQQYFAPYAVQRSPLRQHFIRHLQRKSRRVPSICGACLMIRRDAFDQLQGFDENFELYFEDSDLCYRCARIGWEVNFVAESRIVHHLGQSTRGSWNKTSLIYQQSHIAFYRKHAPHWGTLLLKFYLLFKWLRLRWVSMREPDQKEVSRAYCRAYFQMILEKYKIELEERRREERYAEPRYSS